MKALFLDLKSKFPILQSNIKQNALKKIYMNYVTFFIRLRKGLKMLTSACDSPTKYLAKSPTCPVHGAIQVILRLKTPKTRPQLALNRWL